MPRKNRELFKGAIYHVFDRGVAKDPIFHDDDDRKKFLSFLEEIYLAYNFVLHAFCLMGNHYHLLMQTHEPNLPSLMQRFQCKYAKYFNSKYSRPGYLFQDRYDDRNVFTEQYYATLFRYIALNPIEDRPEIPVQDCIWSSYHDYFYGLDRYPFLEKDLSRQLFARYKINDKGLHNYLCSTNEEVDLNYSFDSQNFLNYGDHFCKQLVSDDERMKIIRETLEMSNLSVAKKKPLFVFLMKRFTTFSDKIIGEIAGYRRLASMSEIYHRFKSRLDSSAYLRQLVAELEKKIVISEKP